MSPTPTPTPAHTHIVSLSLSISETHNVPPSEAPDCPGAATGQCVCVTRARAVSAISRAAAPADHLQPHSRQLIVSL